MAGFISHSTIEAVRNSSDIISIIGEYTKLERRGHNYWGCCPFHGEKTPSFNVDPDKNLYYCFGCQEHGDVITFLMNMDKISYPEAITVLAKKSGIPLVYEDGKPDEVEQSSYKKNNEYIDLYERCTSMFHYILTQTPMGQKGREYIKKRGFTEQTIKKFKLGYAPEDRKWLYEFLVSKNFSKDFLKESGLFSKKYPEITLFSDRLMFPIFNRNGKSVAFSGRILHEQREGEGKYLNSPELPHYKKRETLFCFNFAKKAIRENKKVIICEGNMDCIAYHQSGIEYAVAPLGTAFTDDQVKILQGFINTIILSFDSDEAGQKATLKAILMCRRHNLTVKIIQLKGGKDPAEILLNFGKENLTSQVNSAILDSDYLLNRIGKLYPIDTPEGKVKAAFDFFPYIDSLQSEIQKESSLEQLCQAFNLKPEAVRRDFLNRNQGQERKIIRSDIKSEEKLAINSNAELKGLIAITADLSQYEFFRSKISEQDLQNSDAKRLYRILEECYQKNTFSQADILMSCQGTGLAQLITNTISSGVYQKEQVSNIVKDTINLITVNKLENQKLELIKTIKEFVPVTPEDKVTLDNMIKKKMELDIQVQSINKVYS